MEKRVYLRDIGVKKNKKKKKRKELHDRKRLNKDHNAKP